MAHEENALKKIKIYATWGKVSQVVVDLCQFKNITTVIFSSFPFKSVEVFMGYLMSNLTDLPRIIKESHHFPEKGDNFLSPHPVAFIVSTFLISASSNTTIR